MFLEIPETAWRLCVTRQATHAPEPIFWASSLNFLVVVCCLPGDADWLAQLIMDWCVLRCRWCVDGVFLSKLWNCGMCKCL